MYGDPRIVERTLYVVVVFVGDTQCFFIGFDQLNATDVVLEHQGQRMKIDAANNGYVARVGMRVQCRMHERLVIRRRVEVGCPHRTVEREHRADLVGFE